MSFALIAVLGIAFIFSLQGARVLSTLAWSLPTVYFITAAWSVFELRRKPAEIVLNSGLGAIRSVWDVARGADKETYDSFILERVLPPNRIDGQLSVAIGDNVYTIRPEEWPDYKRLSKALYLTSVGEEAMEDWRD